MCIVTDFGICIKPSMIWLKALVVVDDKLIVCLFVFLEYTLSLKTKGVYILVYLKIMHERFMTENTARVMKKVIWISGIAVSTHT